MRRDHRRMTLATTLKYFKLKILVTPYEQFSMATNTLDTTELAGPLRLDSQLSEEQRMVRDSAKQYARSSLEVSRLSAREH